MRNSKIKANAFSRECLLPGSETPSLCIVKWQEKYESPQGHPNNYANY